MNFRNFWGQNFPVAAEDQEYMWGKQEVRPSLQWGSAGPSPKRKVDLKFSYSDQLVESTNHWRVLKGGNLYFFTSFLAHGSSIEIKLWFHYSCLHLLRGREATDVCSESLTTLSLVSKVSHLSSEASSNPCLQFCVTPRLLRSPGGDRTSWLLIVKARDCQYLHLWQSMGLTFPQFSRKTKHRRFHIISPCKP